MAGLTPEKQSTLLKWFDGDAHAVEELLGKVASFQERARESGVASKDDEQTIDAYVESLQGLIDELLLKKADADAVQASADMPADEAVKEDDEEVAVQYVGDLPLSDFASLVQGLVRDSFGAVLAEVMSTAKEQQVADSVIALQESLAAKETALADAQNRIKQLEAQAQESLAPRAATMRPSVSDETINPELNKLLRERSSNAIDPKQEQVRDFYAAFVLNAGKDF